MSSDNPLSAPEEGQVNRARTLTEDLLEVVRIEHGKAFAVMQQQQVELQHAQSQYAPYTPYAVRSLLFVLRRTS